MTNFFPTCSSCLFAASSSKTQPLATVYNSFTKHLFVAIAVVWFAFSSQAQIFNLRFSSEQATYVPISGTSLVNAFKVVSISIVLFFLETIFSNQSIYYSNFQIDTTSNGMHNCFFSARDIAKNELEKVRIEDYGEREPIVALL